MLFSSVHAQVKICFSDEFQMEQAGYNSINSDSFNTKVWFSYIQQKQRMDFFNIVINQTQEKLEFSWVMDYNTKKWYEVFYFNNTASCSVHDISGTLPRICLASNAEKRGQVILGGTLLTENWIEYLDEQNGTVQLDILLAANVNVPVRLFARDPNGFSSYEYWNYAEGVDSVVFTVPEVCRHPGKENDPALKSVLSDYFLLRSKAFMIRYR